ncbi:hypothetical protein SAMN04487893_11487 [Myroides guanonis]|uniref:Uncharacterized protein n=1 Tax=Myroides guanonis TaxID=1150112 RepID=A0A1I3TV71_9FLAO|nr:hypothetical protein SAMN04487893_11487 [Myroides guanonis]
MITFFNLVDFCNFPFFLILIRMLCPIFQSINKTNSSNTKYHFYLLKTTYYKAF